MSISTSRPRKGAPDFYFKGGVNWFTDDAFVAIERPAAYGLYWALTAWSRGKLTDGLVPDHMVRKLAGDVKASPRLDAAELIRVGLLRKQEKNVRLVNYFSWQESREEVEARRAHAKRGADARWNAPSNAPGNAPSNAHRNATSETETETEILTSNGLSNEQRADLKFLVTTLDRPWPTADLHAKLTELGPDGLLRALAAEHLKQHDVECVHFSNGTNDRIIVKRGR